MASLSILLGLIALLPRPAHGIAYNFSAELTNTESFSSAIVMCNNSFNNANTTGIFTATPGRAQGSSSSQGNGTALGPDVQWALVGAENTKVNAPGYGLQLSLMISPGSNNYFDDSSIGYDACFLTLDPGLFLPNTYLRAQSDNGSALQTFDLRCKTAIQDWANTAAKTANTRQGAGRLPGICPILVALMNQAGSPRACLPFLNKQNAGLNWVHTGAALTQPANTSSSNLAYGCKSTGYNNTTFYNLVTILVDGYSDPSYLIMATVPIPVLTVYMPPTDPTLPAVVSSPYTDMSLLHMTRANTGSKAIPELAAPEPVDYSDYDAYMANSTTNSTTSSTMSASPSAAPTSAGISGGAIAGIVIAIVAVLAIIGAGMLIWQRRRRAQRKGTDPSELDGGTGEFNAEKSKELHSAQIHEISPREHASELSTPHPWHELPNYSQKHEMDGSQVAHELPGSTPEKGTT